MRSPANGLARSKGHTHGDTRRHVSSSPIEHRSRIAHNCWVDVRTEIFQDIYKEPIYPSNLFPPGKPARSLADKIDGAKVALERLYARGQFTPPAGYQPGEMAALLAKRVDEAQRRGALRLPQP